MNLDSGKRPPVFAGFLIICGLIALLGLLVGIDYADQTIWGPKPKQNLAEYAKKDPERVTYRLLEYNGKIYFKLTRHAFTRMSEGIWIYDRAGKLVERELFTDDDPEFTAHWGSPHSGRVIPYNILLKTLELSPDTPRQ